MGQSVSTNGWEALREIVNHRDVPEIDMNEQQINSMLGKVADYINSKGKDITIITVGGAVNTVFLHSRLTTGDVDFFYNTKTQSPEVSLVVEAAKYVAQQTGFNDQWLNNHTAVFLSEDHINTLYAESMTQNAVIFKKTGLTVLAAPWRYAIATKLDRLMKTGAKPYDLADAVRYLHEIVSKQGRPIQRGQLADWATEFKCTKPDDALILRFQNEYYSKYMATGIV